MPEFNPQSSDRDAPTECDEPQPSVQEDVPDRRLYVQNPEGWQAHVKQGWEKQYCYSKSPGEDYFHLILSGEVYLEQADEKLCLTCALRRGVLTTDRLFWQRRNRR